MDDGAQASLFSLTGPVMARALCRQTEARIARLEPYISPQESFRLYSELSLVAQVVDGLEARIAGTPEYRAAQLVTAVAIPAVAPSEPPETEGR